ncbi:hypothetical protein [Streptomyces sp. NPDC048357]|uniref:hypothetical protein n=1 Tax=Streptomyces sp. NPDC048357 TaxID=3154719 RepID=UPI0034469B23
MKFSAICAAATAAVIIGTTAAHADGDGGLLGLGLLETPSITLACFPSGQVGAGNTHTGNQNISCSQSSTASGTGNGSEGVTGAQTVISDNVVFVPQNEVREATVTCPEGKIATGGGHSTSAGVFVAQESRPLTGLEPPTNTLPIGWYVQGTNTSVQVADLRVWAVCVDAAE